MDVREKLVEQAISHFWYGVSHDIFSEPVTTYAKLAIEALKKENGVTVQEWISVKDRLPEKDKEVLCLLGSGECWVAAWDHADDGLWSDGEWWRAQNFVTHWMPLPQPPKGE